MTFKLPELPFAKNALEPYISAETLEYHYGKHHQTYVNNLNQLIINTEFADKDLTTIVTSATGPIFNNAAQTWNHSFYWNCLTDNSPNLLPESKLGKVIIESFGSIETFKEQFTKVAVGHFGSGWAWLVKNQAGKLEILSTTNADNPLTNKKTPLLTCDVWEHAYYIDYRNARAKYVEAFWKIVNWDFIAANLTK